MSSLKGKTHYVLVEETVVFILFSCKHGKNKLLNSIIKLYTSYITRYHNWKSFTLQLVYSSNVLKSESEIHFTH